MIKMRQQFVDTISEIMAQDQNLAVLLGDIGVHGFRQVFADYPTRIYNIGILEQATIGVAAGLATTGLIPVVHTIAPFLVERAFEQLKVDFGYQKLNGNFISVGASYDYAGLGCTHHCPGDVSLMRAIPDMSIVVPGTAKEFDAIFKSAYADSHPTYYRLSEKSNGTDQEVTYGKANLIKEGTQAVVIAIGPLLDPILEATQNLDVTVLYYTTLRPFDAETLKTYAANIDKFILCEPFYSGTLTDEITEALKPKAISIEHIGVPRRFLTNYGSAADHDKHLGLDATGIKKKITDFLS